MTTKRVQLRRTKGWRKPEGAIVVARPSKWGNPYRVEHMYGDHWVVRDGCVCNRFNSRAEAAQYAVDLFRTDLHNALAHPEWSSSPATPRYWPAPFDTIARDRYHLAGHDLACWCPLDQPCHADVLLEVARTHGERIAL